MITDSEKKTIREISERYAAKRVLLFGSNLSYGDLMLGLSKPVDVIDLSGNSKFTKMIRQEGIPLYGSE